MKPAISLGLAAILLCWAGAATAQGRYTGTGDTDGGVWVVDSVNGTVRFCWVEQFAGRARIQCVAE